MRVSFSVFARLTAVAAIMWAGIAGAALSDELITAAEIKLISPKAKNELIQAFIAAEPAFKDAGVNTRLRMAHFVTQVMTETGGMRSIDESLNYSYARALQVFSRRVLPDHKARELAGKPREFANWVYGNRLGNRGRNTDDGWNYRGSGYIQLTGLGNFQRRGREIGLPLDADPNMVREPNKGMAAAVAYWKAGKINIPADDNDLYRVRVLVNGPAAHGYKESKVWFAIAWKKVFKAKAGMFEGGEINVAVETDETGLLNDVLQENGYLPEGFESSSDSTAVRSDAVKAFQRSVGLPETGEIDEETQYELLDQWRYEEGAEAAPASDENREQTVTFNLAQGRESDVVAEPKAGTGERVPGNPTLPADEKQALANAVGSYSEYEMGDKVVEPELFTPHGILGGRDDRKPVTQTLDFPARAIVQIIFQDDASRQKLCSGSMVAPDAVLTAAHCLHSGTVNGKSFKNFRVVPGRNVLSAPFGLCEGLSFSVLSGWTEAVSTSESRYYDLGVLKLNCDVGARTGWFGMQPLEGGSTDKTLVQGYASDVNPRGIQVRSEGSIFAVTSYNAFYDNDTYGGTSGSGVVFGGSPDTLIGVHTTGPFGTEEPWKSYNGFVRLTPERIAKIQEWIGQ
ncbi:trypsin-like serine protease [Ensifer sp. NPDC090286]|uniref:trypsin-like serine protease n=1 Tax=Ensifer sp. NPDC090286 TaxID=3363991 RepID=UPI00383BB60E